MKATSTEGTVRKLEAHTVGYGADKRVVGTMVTIQTQVTDDHGTVGVDTTVFLEPNSTLPVMGDTVAVLVASEEAVELESLSAAESLALGITQEDDDE